MLPSEQVIGPELGEDRDHHPPDQVAAIAVRLGCDRLLEALERGLESPSSQAAKALLRSRLAGAPSASPSSIRATRPSATKSPAKLPAARPPPRARRARAGAAPGRGGLGMTRIERQCLAQRCLVAGGDQLVGGRGDQAVEELLDLRRRDRAGELGDHLAVAKRLDRRDALDAEAAARLWFASTSTLASSTLPARLPTAASSAGPSWRQGPHHSAQKSTTHGQLARALDHVGHELGFIHVFDHCGTEVTERAESAVWARTRAS